MFQECYIVINSRQEYDDVIHLLDSRGYTWVSGRTLLQYDPFAQYFAHKKGMLHVWPDLTVTIAPLTSNEREQRASKTMAYEEFIAEFSIKEETQIRCMDEII